MDPLTPPKPREKSHLPVIISTLFATLLSCLLAKLWIKVSNSSNFGTLQQFQMAVGAIYAFLLTGSGWLYCFLGLRVFGRAHGILMLGVAAFFVWAAFLGTTGGRDNNDLRHLVAFKYAICVVIAALAGLCGLIVLRHLFPRKRTPPHHKHHHR
jgi:hypothetical protein